MSKRVETLVEKIVAFGHTNVRVRWVNPPAPGKGDQQVGGYLMTSDQTEGEKHLGLSYDKALAAIEHL